MKRYILGTLLVTVIIGGLYYMYPSLGTSRNNQPVTSPKEITKEQAYYLVYNRPEVEDFIKRVRDGGGDPHVGIDDTPEVDEQGNSFWTVQVYENLSDHNSTFEWYTVYTKTSRVITPEDQLDQI